jgi:hypothetical protein
MKPKQSKKMTPNGKSNISIINKNEENQVLVLNLL